MLELREVELDKEYRKKFNVIPSTNDFYKLYDIETNQPVNDSIYRIGGFHSDNITGKKLFLLLKQVESYYADNITTIESEKPHLDNTEVLLNDKGEELCINNTMFDYITIYGDCIYCFGKKFYNANTNELICKVSLGFSSIIQSEENVFVPCGKYKEEKVCVINKKDGSYQYM